MRLPYSLYSRIIKDGTANTLLALDNTLESRKMRMEKSQNPESSSMFGNPSVVQENADLKK